MMFRDHNPADERDPSQGARKSDANDLFPAEGTFSPVVPLSEVDGPARTSTSGPSSYVSSDAAASEAVPVAVGADEQDEQEVATLVRPRVSSATGQSPARTFRSVSARRPRHFRAATYALLIITSLTVGALAGLLISDYQKRPARSANVERPAPPAEAGPQVIEPRTDGQHAGPSVTVEPEPEPSAEALSATVIEALPERESPRAGRLMSQHAPPVAASEVRRSSTTEQATRREATVGTPAPRRAASHPALENAGEAPRAASAPRRPQRTERWAGAAPSSRENLPPVFSPPAADSAKRKVIPWP
jgi:hypothetical protein